jgi:hypothetical protein
MLNLYAPSALKVIKGGTKMKKWLLGGLTFLALFLVGCQSQPPAEKPAEKPATTAAKKPARDPKVIEEIRATLAQHDKALGEKNLDALMDTYINDAETVALGTSNGELWVGPENIRNAYTEIFKDYDPNTLDVNCDWKTGQHLRRRVPRWSSWKAPGPLRAGLGCENYRFCSEVMYRRLSSLRNSRRDEG